MKKSTLTKEIASKCKYPLKDIENIVDTMLYVITNSLKEGEAVSIFGFGSFVIDIRKPKELFIPTRNEKIYIAEKKVIKFKPSEKLKKAIK